MKLVPERRQPRIGAARRLRPGVAALEAMVRNDEGEGVAARHPEQVPQHLVLVLVAAIHGAREGPEVRLRDARTARGRVLHEEMPAGIDQLEVDGEQVDPIPGL